MSAKPVSKPARSMPASTRRADRGEDIGGPALEDDVEQGEILVLGDQSQRFAHARGGEGAVAEGERLVGEGEGVAHRAVGGAGEHGQRLGLGGDLLVLEHRGEADRAHRRGRCA